jgi:hypothetical protein
MALTFSLSSWRLQTASAGVALVLAACGGGGSDTATTAGASSSAAAVTVGTVSGFGSVIVGGVRFDDSGATVVDDSGVVRSASALRLGMQVEIESGSVNDSTSRATASHIRFGSELVGPVASVNTTAGSLVLLGQTVLVTSTTVFDDALSAQSSDLSTLVGAVIEVHATYDAATANYTATRIEDKTAATAYKLRGTVAALDATAKTFTLGGTLVSYASATSLPSTALADGQTVRVTLATAPVAGAWVAATVSNGSRAVENHSDARVRGSVSAFTSATSFTVNSVVVNASGAVIDNGPVTATSKVEVRGSTVDGVLVATRVKVYSAGDTTLRTVELHGLPSSIDSTAKTFLLRGITVNYAAVTSWNDSLSEAALLALAANTASTQWIEVKGTLSADRSTLTAVSVSLENGSSHGR